MISNDHCYQDVIIFIGFVPQSYIFLLNMLRIEEARVYLALTIYSY